MKRMLINATQQEELRVALVDGQQLYDLDIETLHSAQKKSNIYKGKITRIEPSLEAVFVDYGSARHGFLPFKEIAKEYLVGSTYTGDGQPSFKDMIRVGQDVLVQIDKEERGNKGAALTTYISLAGRFLVLMPNNPRAGGVSRRIQGDDRRELRDTLDSLDAPDNMGVIVRTAGVGRAQEELQWDLDFLLQLWDAISEEYQKAPPQRLIYQESNIIVRALRDYLRPDIGQILIDDERVYQQATDFMKLVMPNNINKLKLYNDNIPLFTRYQIEGQIETAYQRNVQLPSGGELVIDYTEALVSIDINSSRATKGGDIEETAYQTNLEAADEIARQLRLRDLGGLIVIDFIDMGVSRNRKDVEQRLMDATNIDRARIQIGRISRFGLLEMSRQRLRPSLDEASHQVCPRCKGQGSIRGIQSMALSLLRLIEEEAMKERTVRITGELPVAIATFLLNEKRHAIRQIELRNGVEVILVPNPNLHTPDYHIERLRDDEVSEEMARTPSYRVPVRRESEEDTAQKAAARALPEQAAVQGVVPQSPVPQAKGLSAFFSKVVALFKEDRNASKPGQKARGNDKGEKSDSRDNGERSRRRDQDGQRNGRRNNGERRRRYERDEDPARDNFVADEADNARQEVPAVAEHRAEKEKPAREERGERGERNNRRERNAAVKDDVNPSLEALANPPQEINGREVRKGRPRDVNAVRGQGKAEETRLHLGEENAAQAHEILEEQALAAVAEAPQQAVVDTAEEAVVLTDLQDGAQDFVPSAAELQGAAPGMVAMLLQDAPQADGNPAVESGNAEKTAAEAP
ncbi:MAG: Rne/Rng family ribonuclease, partial [Cardiobacteriaceae bacterium]|nr:Rne/Rng family ribonuclease [Cardiobacteriaceae bacterium]